MLRLVAEVDVDRLELAAADARRAGTAARLSGGARALPRRAAAREPLRRLGAASAATSSSELAARARGRARRARPGPTETGSPRCPRTPARSSDASSELAELKALLRRHAAAHPRRHRRRGQDAAGARAGARRRVGVSGRRGVRRTRRRSPTPACPGRDRRRARRAGAVGTELARRGGRRSSRRARCCSCSTTASTCSERSRRSPTRCCAPPRADDPRDEPRAAARSGRGRVPGSVAGHPRSRTAACAARSCSSMRPCSCSSSGRAAAAPGLCARRGQRRRRRADLLSPRRPAARARARRGPLGGTRSGGDRASGSTIASDCCARGSHAAPTRQHTLAATLAVEP